MSKQTNIIVIEGPDGCGKTSLAKDLEKLLDRDYDGSVYLEREPGGTPAGEEIRRVIKSFPTIPEYSKLMLYMASRTVFIDHNILDDALSNQFLIMDRFLESSFVFQQELGYDCIRNAHLEMFKSLKIQEPIKYLCIYLDLNPEVIQKRLTDRGMNDCNDVTDLESIQQRANLYKETMDKLAKDKEILKYIQPTYKVLHLSDNVQKEMLANVVYSDIVTPFFKKD